MLARQAVKLKQKVIGKQNADGVCSAKGKNENWPLWKVPHGVCNKEKMP